MFIRGKVGRKHGYPIDAAGNPGVQHPTRKASIGLHLNPLFLGAIPRVLGTATGPPETGLTYR